MMGLSFYILCTENRRPLTGLPSTACSSKCRNVADFKVSGVAILIACVGPAGSWDGTCPSAQSFFELPLRSRFSASTIGVEIASKSETVKLIGPLVPALAIRLVSVRHRQPPIL